MATSNTKDVFREGIGRRIVGFYEEQHEIGPVYVLVLDDGTGIAFGSKGAHWTVSADDVRRRVAERRRELQQVERDLRDVLATEAVLAASGKEE